MAITFAVRGDDLNARYSSAGKIPAIIGVNDPAEVNTDQAGINGSTSIDMAGAFLTLRSLVYIGRENTPTGIARSVLMRVKFASLGASQGLFGMGTLVRSQVNYFGMRPTTGGEIVATAGNNLTQTDTGTSSGAALGTTNWHDIVLTWTGDTTANGLEIWVDGTRRLQDTMTRSMPTMNANEVRSVNQIAIGPDYTNVNSHYYLDEFVIWDSVIDPTSVTLTSGSGSLNGNSRSAYVDVAEFDGLAASGGGSGLVGTGGISF